MAIKLAIFPAPLRALLGKSKKKKKRESERKRSINKYEKGALCIKR